MSRLSVALPLLLVCISVCFADRGAHYSFKQRHSWQWNPWQQYYGRCPVFHRQRFSRRHTQVPGPTYQLPDKRVMLFDISSEPQIATSRDIDLFLRIHKDNGVSKQGIIDYINQAMVFYRDVHGFDFTNYTHEDVLQPGGIVTPDEKVKLEVSTFSASMMGANYQNRKRMTSDTANKRCRTFNRQPVDSSGLGLYFLKDVTSPANVLYKGGTNIFSNNNFIRECGITILIQMVSPLNSSEDPRRPGTILNSAQLEGYTDHDNLGWGTGKYLDKFDVNTRTIIDGWNILNWNVATPRSYL